MKHSVKINLKKVGLSVTVIAIAAASVFAMTACGAKKSESKTSAAITAGTTVAASAVDNEQFNTVAPYNGESGNNNSSGSSGNSGNSSSNNSAAPAQNEFNTVAPYQNNTPSGGSDSSKEYNTVAPYQENTQATTTQPAANNDGEFNTVAPYNG